MRVGRIIRVKLNGQNHLGVVKSYNPEGLTAVFPVSNKADAVVLHTMDFTKEGEDKPHSISSHDFTDFGHLLRQLTGIAKEEKPKDKPKPDHDTTGDVLGEDEDDE
jgi:predicted GTPase